jgi:Ser/Thr protein kinase RdoA (MazF antagonist)
MNSPAIVVHDALRCGREQLGLDKGDEIPLVHGLDGTNVPPDWPFLTLTEVDCLLRAFPAAGGAERILSYSPRPFSSASIVRTQRGEVFVKRHHRSIRDRDGLREEHAFMKHLRANGVPVPEVLTDGSGDTVFYEGPWTYEVHGLAPGVDAYAEAPSWTPFQSVQHAESAGRSLAALHNASRSYRAPARQTRTLVTGFSIFSSQDPFAAIQDFLQFRPDLAKFLVQRKWAEKTDELLIPFYERLAGYLPSLPPLWTHNDLHASNLLWSSLDLNAKVACTIDFGLSNRTTAIHDLATAIERNCVEWLRMGGDLSESASDITHLDQMDALVEGYLQVRPLAASEQAALVALLPIVHAEFALSEADYFLRVLGSEAKAGLAWDGYYLGHAQWFYSRHGREMLTRLEAAVSDSRSNSGFTEAVVESAEVPICRTGPLQDRLDCSRDGKVDVAS